MIRLQQSASPVNYFVLTLESASICPNHRSYAVPAKFDAEGTRVKALHRFDLELAAGFQSLAGRHSTSQNLFHAVSAAAFDRKVTTSKFSLLTFFGTN